MDVTAAHIERAFNTSSNADNSEQNRHIIMIASPKNLDVDVR